MKSIFLLCCSILIFQVSVFSQTIPDSQLKRKVTPIGHSLYKVLQLEPIAFEYNIKSYPQLNLDGGIRYGFKAENMAQLFPDLVSTRLISYRVGKNHDRDTKINTVNEQGLIPFLVASIKEQQKEIEQLKEEIAELRTEVNKSAK